MNTLFLPDQPKLSSGFKKNIWIVAEPGINGVWRHVKELILEAINVWKWDITYFYSTCRSGDEQRLFVETLRAASIDCIDLCVGAGPQVADFNALVVMAAKAQKRRPSLIIAHSSKAGGLARLGAKLGFWDGPIVYVPHAYYQTEKLIRGQTSLFHWLERWFGSEGITFHVSQSEANIGRHFFWLASCRQFVTTNWVNIRRFIPGQSNDHSEGLVLGTIGRFSDQKNYLALHKALVSLAIKRSGWRFVHLGEGPGRDECERLWTEANMSSRVDFISFSSEPEKVLKAWHGFVLASHYEGMPLVVLEAASSGLALLLTPVPGLVDFDHFGFDGLQYFTGMDHNHLFLGLSNWIDKLQSRPENNHREIVEKYFSASKVLLKSHSVFNSLMNCSYSVR